MFPSAVASATARRRRSTYHYPFRLCVATAIAKLALIYNRRSLDESGFTFTPYPVGEEAYLLGIAVVPSRDMRRAMHLDSTDPIDSPSVSTSNHGHQRQLTELESRKRGGSVGLAFLRVTLVVEVEERVSTGWYGEEAWECCSFFRGASGGVDVAAYL